MDVTLRLPVRLLTTNFSSAILRATCASQSRVLFSSGVSRFSTLTKTPRLYNRLPSRILFRTQQISARNLSTEIQGHSGRLANKVAVVTGSSAGIGRAVALAYAREGAKVVCSDLHPLAKVSIGDETHIATHDAIMKEGGVGVFVKCDVSEAHEVEELVHEAVEIFGRIDIFVNNAGICMEMQDLSGPALGHPLHLTPVSTFDKTMLINTRGTFLGCKYAIAQMMKQGVRVDGSRGWIINMASIAGLIGSRGAASYSTSKGGIVQLTRSAAVEYGRDRIHVNAICPGIISTAMTEHVAEQADLAVGLQAAHPWGSFGKVKDVAGAAVFLASEDASFVTGVLLPVDGGYVAQ